MNKMMNMVKNIGIAVIMLFTISIVACDSNNGPLEKAGKNIDEAATDLGNKVEDACEDVKDGMGAKDTDC